jgi:hypothetical protein
MTRYSFGKGENTPFNEQYKEKEEKILSTHYRYVEEKTQTVSASDFTEQRRPAS